MSSFPSNRPPPIITNVPQMYPPPMLPSMHPAISAAQSRTGYRPPQIYNNPPNIPFAEEDGPLVTVFIGNLSEKAPDTMIKKILACCGLVVNWKRVSTFGFCEYDGPVSGGRAVRLLHDLDLDGKKLVAKVDAKNKQLLDSYKEEETKKSENSNSKTRDADSEKRFDASTMERIEGVLEEYKDELKALNANSDQPPAHKQSKQTHQSFEIEEGKRDLINKEIGKFRKYAEEEELKKEKEKDRKKREIEKRGSDKDRNADNKDKDKSRRSPSPNKKQRRRSRSRSRERERERREKKLEREKERDLERLKEREEREIRDRERQREREREREIQEPKVFKNVKELQKEKEMEDEARDRKKNEKRIRDKEAAYQERLRNWEFRERRKGKEYEKEREKEFCREEEREKEAKCLKEFLEDYDDERDDPKYYKSRELQRRTAERTREREADEKDRIKEQEELDELKSKIFSGTFEDPTQEFERLKKEREELYKPKILIDVNLEQSQQREKELEREYQRDLDRQRARDRQKKQKEQYVIEQANREMAAIDAEPIDSDSSGGQQDFPSSPPPNHHAMSRHGSESRDSFTNNNDVMINNDEELSSNSLLSNTPTQNSPGAALNPASTGLATGFSLNLNANIKKKKIDVKDVFNMDEDGEEISVSKKRKLVPLDYEDPKSKRRADEERHANNKKSSDDAQRSQEEKRKHVKSIIDKIPTAKAELFNFPLDWAEIDATIERKVRPWINKKIIEYIGEPEPTLVDFICSKVLAGSTPQSILDDVQMVLDEEAEVFVVKMWRLLIYEVEAKKRGLK